MERAAKHCKVLPREVLDSHPRRCSRNIWMWHLVLCSDKMEILKVKLDDLEVFSNLNACAVLVLRGQQPLVLRKSLKALMGMLPQT